MRIAIFEPRGRLCGVTKSVHELLWGFRSLGHDADVVSFTKSGRTRRAGEARAGWYWWPVEPTVTGKWHEAGEVLSKYDLVLLNEPKNGTEDRAALREKREPDYIQALERCTSPWLTFLFAPQYDAKRAPFLERTMTAGNGTGIVVEHQPGAIASANGAFDGRLTLVQPWPWLPYHRRGAPEDVRREQAIAVSGRCTANKGHVTLAWHADRFPPGWTTRLHGSEAGGMSAGVSYIVWAGLVAAGWTGFREGNYAKGLPPDERGNYGDKIKGWPWWLQSPDGQHLIRYEGSYDDAVGTLARSAVACGLTNLEFSAHVEYSVLEAMDAGCAVVLPETATQITPGNWSTYPIAGYERALTHKANGEPCWDRFDAGVSASLVEQVNRACADVISGAFDPRPNWETIDQMHDPRLLAQRVLDLAVQRG